MSNRAISDEAGKITRFTKSSHCPVCGGHESLGRGHGVRCHGFLSSDGRYAHCTRTEYAGGLSQEPNGTYAHRLDGSCQCGARHGNGASISVPVAHGGNNGRRYFPTTAAYFHEMEKYLTRKHQVVVNLIRIDEYHDAAGNPCLAEGRFEWGAGFKSYPVCHFTEHGWCTGDPEGQLPLWGLPDVINAETVLVLEGPKCAKIAKDLGFVATTNSHGGKSASKTDWAPLAGKTVVLIPDNDKTGEFHETTVREHLAALSNPPIVKVLKLPGLEDSEDIEQWKDRCPELWGPDEIRTELQRLIDEAPTSEETWATAADVLRFGNGLKWIWDRWLLARSVNAIVGDAGTGKSRLFGHLHKLAHLGMEWPDGSPPDLDLLGCKSLWICSDGNHIELPMMLESYGVPLDSVIFPAQPENPFSNTFLDSEESQAAIRRCIAAERPTFVVIDSLTTSTGSDLCSVKDLQKLKILFHSWTQDFNCTVILICHLSKEGSIFGRHAAAMARSIIDLNCPDPITNYERLSMTVTKSFAPKPPPLGVTMSEFGNTYDAHPPDRVVNGKTVATKTSAPANAVNDGKKLILNALSECDGQIANMLFNTWLESKPKTQNYKELHSAFWSAVNFLVRDRLIRKEGGRGTGCQVTLHLTAKNQEQDDSNHPF